MRLKTNLLPAFLLLWNILSAQPTPSEINLGKAAEHHRLDEIERYLQEKKINLEAKTGYWETTALFRSVRNAYGPDDEKAITATKMLLDAGANLKTTDKFGTTILHLAVSARWEWLVRLCLKKGVKINAMSETMDLPLSEAFIIPDKNIIRLLIDEGADIQFVDEYGTTFLHEAARLALDEFCLKFLDKGLDPAAKTDNGTTAAFYYVNARGNNREIFERIIPDKAQIPALLQQAVVVENLAFLKYIADQELPMTDAAGDHLLFRAAMGGKEKVVKWFWEKGVDLNMKNADGETALFYAMMNVQLNVLKFLLQNGADPNIRRDDGKTPLHMIPQVLVSDTEPRLRSRAWTPPPPNPVPALQLLVDSGGKKNVKDNSGKTPADYIFDSENQDPESRLYYQKELEAFFEE